MPGTSNRFIIDGTNNNENGTNLNLSGALGLSLGQNQIQEATVVIGQHRIAWQRAVLEWHGSQCEQLVPQCISSTSGIPKIIEIVTSTVRP